jgi:Uma2 family endonuclease
MRKKIKKIKQYQPKEEEAKTVEEPVEIYLSPTHRYTYADYLTWTDDKRRELIDGIVFLMSAPTRFHAGSSGSIFNKLYNFVTRRKEKCKVYHAPFDIRFPKNGETANDKIYTVVQPDICVICDPKKLDEAGCIGAPDLIVEVQSPSTAKRDLQEKFNLYESSGVKEYWVVYPKEKALTIFLLRENGKYDNGTTYQSEGKIPVSIFNGLEINLEELFED